MEELTLLQKIAVWALPVIFAITVHETAHGWVASRFGDQTARLQGRITLNPFKHIDLVGTIVVPIILLALGGFIFGWAKPVPIDYRNLRKPRRDSAFVAAAGPLANLIMAIFWSILLHISFIAEKNVLTVWLIYTSQAGIIVNLLLMLFNFLPIPPLDGSVVLASFLKGRALMYYEMLRPWGFFILLALLVTGILKLLIGPIFYMLVDLFI